ncbi:PucR family transcriptional regulator ligand-binding domain-containing protein [Mycolicibacterium goodii]|uniref:PucR family transcriptional regulator ligand-binding domain-containing protein n=2 Tax=Mycolicibacterium goodii TaxID=134601 RepID=A0ABS6HXA5_MYCGD|nr:PucR family transcriptional regulator ligand-binding domain-containing protein [Mycolicibacterium goodii]MBU8840991.1 PucR family transcriptional regulator ligand-binding domain-containing protein [Mycolicibacterium goodii]
MDGAATGAEVAPHAGNVWLRTLLTQPDLQVDALTPIHDADRPIRYVYPTELADPSPYLTGGELILSVGVPVTQRADDEIHQYVATLSDRGVTALMVGLGDLFDEPPAALVRACLHRNLPLLTLPPDVPFRRIVDWAEARRAADREAGKREGDLGSILRWFVAGTLGVGPVEHALADCGLVGSPVAVCAFNSHTHVDVHRLVDRHAGTVALLDDNRIVALCAHTDEFRADLAASPLACGVAIAPDAAAMVYAIPEALEALHEATRWRRTVHIDEIATLDGLLAAVPKVRLVPFVQRLIAPLVEHDKVNSSCLVSSLEAFLEPRNDINTAAAQLYVHVNTLRNRLAKIAELTGSNPLDESDRVNFRIALWAARNMGMGAQASAAQGRTPADAAGPVRRRGPG